MSDDSTREWLRGLLGTPIPHSPSIMYVGCSDARLSREQMGIRQGDAFIVRSIAARVPPQSEGPITDNSPDLVMGTSLDFSYEKSNPVPQKKLSLQPIRTVAALKHAAIAAPGKTHSIVTYPFI